MLRIIFLSTKKFDYVMTAIMPFFIADFSNKGSDVKMQLQKTTHFN
jgi:hypothetical protein